jgi:hypothetical protein
MSGRHIIARHASRHRRSRVEPPKRPHEHASGPILGSDARCALVRAERIEHVCLDELIFTVRISAIRSGSLLLNRSSVAAIVIAAALTMTVAGAAAFDESKYPDFESR